MSTSDPLTAQLAPSARRILAELRRRHTAAATPSTPRPWFTVHLAELAAVCELAYFTAARALAALRELGAVESRRHGPQGVAIRFTREGLAAGGVTSQ